MGVVFLNDRKFNCLIGNLHLWHIKKNVHMVVEGAMGRRIRRMVGNLMIEQNINLLLVEKMLFQHPAPKPRGEDFQSRRQIKNLTTASKNLYIFFNTFQLEMSRLSKIMQFQDLVTQITMFNDQLDKWKKDKHNIPNIVLTYHLYQNLFSRLKYISNFSRNQQDALNAANEANRWFQVQKPKVRCQAKETKASMKAYTPDKKQSDNIESLVQTSALKREMLPYEMMSRTAHPGIFPPKQELKNYKRKQFLPYGETEPAENYMTAKKSTSASLLQRSKLSKFRASVTTMMGTTSTSNFKQTKNSLKGVQQFKIEEITEDKNNDDVKVEEQQQKNKAVDINEEQLDEIERQKKVNQDQAMQQNLVQPVNEEDEPDEDQIYDEQEDAKKQTQIYIRDHDKIDMEIAEEEAKEAVHSTLRRVMKINEEKIRSKMEELDLKRNMITWGKAKGKNNRDEARKLQTLMHLNKYKNLEFQRKSQKVFDTPEDKKFFNATTGFKDFKSSKQPVVVPMLFRSKSSHPTSMEVDIQKLKIKEAMRTYGRYINNHIPSQVDSTPMQVESKENKSDSTTDFRSMSLTSFAQRGKKKSFSTVIGSQNPQFYNQNAESDLARIKSTLSGKSLSVEKGLIYKALSIIPKQDTLITNGMYTSGKDLLSNPFFPKHLYGAKKKKKKSKK